jgi:hypothetical protein
MRAVASMSHNANRGVHAYRLSTLNFQLSTFLIKLYPIEIHKSRFAGIQKYYDHVRPRGLRFQRRRQLNKVLPATRRLHLDCREKLAVLCAGS